MIVACACTLLMQGAQVPAAVTWVKLSESKPKYWSATAKYPVLGGTDPLSVKANELLRAQCEARFREFVAGRQDTIVPPSRPRVFVLDSFVSVTTSKLVSFQVSVKETGGAESDFTELSPLTCALVAGMPRALAIAEILDRGADLSRFMAEVALPAANEARRVHGMDGLKELPPDVLKAFAVTKLNLALAVGPGIVSANADQIRIPLASLGSWLDPKGPLGSGAAQSDKVEVRVTGYATWIHRETLPIGSELVVSLLRDRDDPLETAFGSVKFFVLTPPANFEAKYTVEGVGDDDRLYLDVRIVADGKTLYRNRAATRVPLQGWASKREVRLVKEDP